MGVGKLLIKFPIRERRDSFLEAFHLYATLSTTKPEFLFTVDTDDTRMRKPEVWRVVEGYGLPYTMLAGPPAGKIAACNRDLSEHNSDWTTVLLASDDMHPIVQGYDQIILDEMAKHFPDNDGALWFHQTTKPQQSKTNFVEVVGRKRFEEQGYLYNPTYHSLFADDEQTQKGIREGKLVRIDREIIKNQSYFWGGKNREDQLYRKNNRAHHRDRITFETRKHQGFPA